MPKTKRFDEKVSFTIESECLNWLQKQVFEGRFASVSHGVRYAIKKLYREEKKVV